MDAHGGPSRSMWTKDQVVAIYGKAGAPHGPLTLGIRGKDTLPEGGQGGSWGA